MKKNTLGRKDRLIREKSHDTYKEKGKPSEPTHCTECHAVFARGRWSWAKPEKGAHPVVCPACRRIADRFPAGYIELRGNFLKGHRAEITQLILNVEEQEKTARPLERIMSMKEEGNQSVIMTTGIHLARRIGEALARSYKGEYSFRYGDGEENLRVYWER